MAKQKVVRTPVRYLEMVLVTSQSYIRDRDHVFDRDLILDKLDSLHHQAQNFLLRFKARIFERGADITTKLLDRRCQGSLSMLFLLLLSERKDIFKLAGVFVTRAGKRAVMV